MLGKTMSKLHFEVEKHQLPDGSPVIVSKIVGMIDGYTFKDFEKHICNFFDQGFYQLIVLMGGVTYINSTGMGLLVKLEDKFKDAGGDIKLVNIPEKVSTLFKMLGFSNYFQIFDTQDQAMAAIGQTPGGEDVSRSPATKMETAQKTPLSVTAMETKSIAETPLDIGEDSEALVIEDDDGSGMFPSREEEEEEERERMVIDIDKDKAKDSTKKRKKQVTDVAPTESSHRRDAKAEPPKPPPPPQKSKKLQRNIFVRYFRRMCPLKSFPLRVIFSSGKISGVAHPKLAQVDAGQPLIISKDNSIVEVIPTIPASLVAPFRKQVDIAPEMVDAWFEVTPLVQGNFERAGVEIYYQGRLVQSIPIPMSVNKQTWAKVSCFLGIISPIASLLVDFYSARIAGILPSLGAWTAKVAAVCQRPFWVGASLAGIFLVAAAILYYFKRPVEADPIESMMNVQESR